MRIWSLVWKELLVVLRDPRSRISIFLPPITQLLIFSFAATLDVKDVSIGIWNRDRGEQSFELLQRFHGAPLFKKITYLDHPEQIRPFIDRQEGLMVISIDEPFSQLLDERKPTHIQLICDGRKSNTTQILVNYAQQIIARYNLDLHALERNIPGCKIELIPRNWFNPNILYIWYNIPSLVGILSMLTCLVVTSQSIAREREMGTFDQLLVSPFSPLEILVGKIIPGILIGTAEGLLMWALGVGLLGVPFTGSFPLFFLTLLVFVTAISGVGLFISSLSATQQQAMLGTFVFMLPSTLLSGFATPIENMPSWLQPLTYAIPFRYMLVLSKGLFLKNLPPSIVFSQIWPMVLIGIGTLAIAVFFAKRRLQ